MHILTLLILKFFFFCLSPSTLVVVILGYISCKYVIAFNLLIDYFCAIRVPLPFSCVSLFLFSQLFSVFLFPFLFLLRNVATELAPHPFHTI